jgi:hypothetical protein
MTRKRIRSLIAFGVLVAILLGGGLVLRNFILSQVKKRIQSALEYQRVHLHLFPPTIIFEEVQTVSLQPAFSAKQVSISLPLASLLKNEKPLTVFIDRPVVRIVPETAKAGEKGKSTTAMALPFALDKGVVRDGEVYYLGSRLRFQAKGLKAILKIKGDTFSIRLESEENALWLGPERGNLEGRIELSLEGKRDDLAVNKLILDGPEVIVKMKGRLTGIRDPQGSLPVSFRADMDALSRLLKIPFDWQGRIEGSGVVNRTEKSLLIRTSFSSDDLVLNRVPLEKVRGRVEVLPGARAQVEMNIQRKSGPEQIKIQSASGRVNGELEGFHLDPVLSYVSLPWPVASPIWGSFTVDDRRLSADFEFRDDAFSVSGNKYPFRGPVHFAWDRKREIQFSSPELETSFGRLGFNGTVVTGSEVDVTIQGEVSDVKSGREFTELVLSQSLAFPEIRGRGSTLVAITGSYSSPDVKMDFTLSPAGFDRFDVAAAVGTVEISRGTVRGRFQVDDPLVHSKINFMTSADGLGVEIQLADGDVTKIFSGLDLQLPLRGNAGGYFQVEQRENKLRVDGIFSSSLLQLGPQDLRQVEGKLSWDGEYLSFPELAFDLYGGKIKASSRLQVENQALELDLTGENIDLSFFSPNLTGELSLQLKSSGLVETEGASGDFSIPGLRFDPFQETEARGTVAIRLAQNKVLLNAKGNFLPGENMFTVEAEIPLVRDNLAIDVKGGFENLDLLLPWTGAKGKLNYVAELRGIPPDIRINGGVDFQGPLLPFPEFAQAVTDYSGLVFIKNNVASIRSFNGKLGGGDIQGSGETLIGKSGLENISFNLEGKNLLLSPFERTRALADASLRLVKNQSRFSLEGDIDVKRVSWRRGVYEKFAFSSSPYPAAQRQPNVFDDLTLNIRLRADDNAWMENSLGRIRGRFDLTISGSVKAPIILGEIESLGGEVNFQDRKFQVLRGRLSFFNPASIEPYLDFRGETYIKDYRVTITLSGLVSQIRPEFSSSPPLPPEDVLALLALGEAFKRYYSAETSSRLSTASLLSFQLTEEAQKRTEGLFSLDRFRIDPFLMGSSAEMTARLTVGKKISKDFLIYYSTNLTRQTEEIIRLEWDFTNEFSLVGTRNEIGRVSFDVKFRRRF